MNDHYDIVGVGLGPGNLSLAALLHETFGCSAGKRVTFLEKNMKVDWHRDQQIPESTVLSEFYFDLVTPVAPRSRFTFLNYLEEVGRLEQFILSQIQKPTRQEYGDYFDWVANKLPEVKFGATVGKIFFDSDQGVFRVPIHSSNIGDHLVSAQHLSLGIGRTLKSIVGSNLTSVISAKQYRDWSQELTELKNKQFAVVGAGQSAAEIVNDMMVSAPKGSSINWFVPYIFPKDIGEHGFALELFLDSGITKFYDAVVTGRHKDQGEYGLTSGIDPSLSKQLLARAYNNEILDRGRLKMHHLSRVKSIEALANGQLTLNLDGRSKRIGQFDAVVYANGFEDAKTNLSTILDQNLIDQIESSEISRDYSFEFGNGANKVFLQSMNAISHGETDGNYVVAPFRNRRILKSFQ